MKPIPRWIRSTVWVLAAAAFIAAAVIIVRRHPELLHDLRLLPLAAALALVPLAVGLNVIEYRLSARYLGLSVSWAKALEIIVLGSAANMLPLPGATVVRAAGLVGEGGRPAKSAGVTLTFACSWLAVSCLYSGGALILCGYREYGIPVTIAGSIALVAFFAISMFAFGRRLGLPLAASAIKLGVVVVEAIQIYLCFASIHIPISFTAASAIQVSAVAGSALAIVPAGLGVREGVAALLGAVIGLGHASAFLAVALNRMLAMILMVPLALLLAARRK